MRLLDYSPANALGVVSVKMRNQMRKTMPAVGMPDSLETLSVGQKHRESVPSDSGTNSFYTVEILLQRQFLQRQLLC